MVALAAGSSGRSTEISCQTKITTVMLVLRRLKSLRLKSSSRQPFEPRDKSCVGGTRRASVSKVHKKATRAKKVTERFK